MMFLSYQTLISNGQAKTHFSVSDDERVTSGYTMSIFFIWPVRPREQFPWKTIRKTIPYEGRTRWSDRAGKIRTALLEMRTAPVRHRCTKKWKWNEKSGHMIKTVRPDLEPNIFPSGPPTQSVSTHYSPWFLHKPTNSHLFTAGGKTCRPREDPVSNSNRTEWSPIRSVIIRVTTKSQTPPPHPCVRFRGFFSPVRNLRGCEQSRVPFPLRGRLQIKKDEGARRTFYRLKQWFWFLLGCLASEDPK